MTEDADAKSNAKACRELIRSNPADAEAYWRLACLHNVRFEPNEVEAMHEHLAFDHVTGETRAQFLFALGKACEDDGDYKRALRFYKEGNATRRAAESYDPLETRTRHSVLIETFTAEFLERTAGLGSPDASPIFIVGMPMSGMTLLEQILAAHSRVDGTGETQALDAVIGSAAYPESLREADADMLRKLAAAYLDAVAAYRGDAERFIDTTPTNFKHIGLIHLLLPNAKIIDARCHPLESCIGAFKQLFVRGHPYSYDLQELGDYYLEYRRMMNHWHTVLPGKVLDVCYEDLVANPGAQVRRLLDHCGLGWEDGCLDFPRFDRSSEYWQHFENELGDLVETLQPLLQELPDKP